MPPGREPLPVTSSPSVPRVSRPRVVVPSLPEGVLARPRLHDRLDRTVARGRGAVVAGPGAGKTVLLASWAAERERVSWYTASESDDTAASFLAHVVAALQHGLGPGSLASTSALLVPDPSSTVRPADEHWRGVVDALVDEWMAAGPSTLVVDDAHRLPPPAMEALAYVLRYLPEGCAIVVAARALPVMREWSGWVLRGQASVIASQEMLFTRDEVAALLSHRRHPLGEAAEDALWRRVGGWPLGLDLLTRGVLADAASWREGDQAPLLTDYIGQEIWEDVKPADQAFLLACRVLRTWTLSACQALAGGTDARETLARLQALGVISPCGADAWRLHEVFVDFLAGRAGESLAEGHARAARALADSQPVEAVHHWQEAARPDEAVRLLVEVAPTLLSQGRSEALLALSERIPPDERMAHLELVLHRGEAFRRRSSYQAALAELGLAARVAHERCEAPLEGRALLGEGAIMVETVQPARARLLLRQAWRLLPPALVEERARLLDLLAENCVNEGRARAALRYRRLSHSLPARPASPALDARLLLRTGRLQAARAAVQGRLEASMPRSEAPAAAHRDEILVLAYLAAVEGDATTAEGLARRGLDQAVAAGSVFTEAVARMRLGHALQLGPEDRFEEVLTIYARAEALAEQTGVDRIRAEALMGLALACASHGDLPRAYACATDGLALARAAGDAWLSSWMRLTVGIAGVLGSHPSAATVLREARADMERCGDGFGVAVADLWRAVGSAGPERAPQLAQAIGRARDRGYGFLVERPSLFGPRAPLEVAEPAPPADACPEPVLRIQCLGTFRVWRRGLEVTPRAWKREKARELFLVLLTRRGAPCQKETLMDLLWPDSTPEAANRDFRVALHALSEALDPERPRNALAHPLQRRGTAYILETGPTVEIDADEMQRLVVLGSAREASGDSLALWKRALDLYHGDYLEEYPYQEWAEAERERLRRLFLETGERLAVAAMDAGDLALAADTAHAMIARDRCWEEAWRILMRVHARQGRAFLGIRCYEECCRVLEDELGVDPSTETTALYETLRAES